MEDEKQSSMVLGGLNLRNKEQSPPERKSTLFYISSFSWKWRKSIKLVRPVIAPNQILHVLKSG